MGRFVRTLSASVAILATGLGAASAATLDKVRQVKSIRLAVRWDAPPFSYRGANGDPAGFMVDLCRAVAAGLAAELNLNELKVEFVPVTAQDRFDAIASGKADLLCEPTSETLSRREKVDFSIPTFVDGASLLVKGDGPSGEIDRLQRASNFPWFSTSRHRYCPQSSATLFAGLPWYVVHTLAGFHATIFLTQLLSVR